MDSIRRLLRSPVTTIVLFLAAAALLLTGTIGGSRAALSYYSDNYLLAMQMQKIGVTLNENGRAIAWRDYDESFEDQWDEQGAALLANMLGEDETLKLDVAYPEALSVTNSGTVDEYVRVRIYRYWVDADEEKQKDLDPQLIELGLVNPGAWREDTAVATPERMVLYYQGILPAGGTTPNFMESVTISGDVARAVKRETKTVVGEDGNTYRTIETTYAYNGMDFRLVVEADAVQTHNAEEAVPSAWGVGASLVGVR